MHIETPKPSISKNVALGIAQIILWGGSYFILSVLADPIMKDTGWSYAMVYGSLSIALLISGLLLPKIGSIINEKEKNLILPYAGFVMAGGLVILGLSEHFLLFLSGWVVIGVAMGMGLYDALFASLGKNYGKATSKVIVQVTLIASLAPTISWSIVSLLLSNYGWRNTCFIYAILLLVTVYPIHRFAFPAAANSVTRTPHPVSKGTVPADIFHSKLFYLLLSSFTIGAVLTTGIVVHLIDILLAKGITMATIISIVAFLGPSQAVVRVIELVFSKNAPVRTAIIAAFATLIGILLFLFDPNVAYLGVILFGMGNGLRSILRGTLPLAVFGQESYAVVIGKLARFPLLAQAITPFICGFLIQQFSVSVFIYTFCLLALVNIILCFIIRQEIAQQKEYATKELKINLVT